MPLQTPIHVNDDCTAVLWQIDEDEPTLRADLPLTMAEADDLANITHPAQRVEWLACRVALRALVGPPYAGLWKDEFGKPHLIRDTYVLSVPENQLVSGSGHISLSHTAGWAAAVWHRTRPVGVDIEPLRTQFGRVVPRVLSQREMAHANGDLMRLAVYWCAKEALYKLYGKRQLTFREHLLIDPFADGDAHLIGHVRLPDHHETIRIVCHRAGPGLMAVAF
ncbi:MAG: 4'-phosphopantetheinyl transferase superfamily protein [Bacteroidetes bacterium]|nr:4'-phosphopantetheinyl transferase superfamily protein [Fibrella sp.]